MTWQNVTVIALILASAVSLFALNQATIAASLVTAVVGMLGLVTRLGSPKDRAPVPPSLVVNVVGDDSGDDSADGPQS